MALFWRYASALSQKIVLCCTKSDRFSLLSNSPAGIQDTHLTQVLALLWLRDSEDMNISPLHTSYHQAREGFWDKVLLAFEAFLLCIE